MSLAVEPRRTGRRTGTHARLSGLYGDPAGWVILAAFCTWALRMLHQRTCQQNRVDAPVKTMLRMCYSDQPIIWQTNQWGSGAPILTDATGLPQTPVVSALAALARAITARFVPVGPTTSGEQQLVAGNVFMVVTAVLLFCLFLAWTVAHMLMGRSSTLGRTRAADGRLLQPPARSQDALFIATSVGVLSTGLISWDLVAPALTALALLAWSLGRPLVSGVLTGLALGAGLAPLVLIVALVVLCVRAGTTETLARYATALVPTFLLVLVLASVASIASTRKVYFGLLDPQVGYGSIWWILQQNGVPGTLIPGFSKLAIVASAIGVAMLSFHAPRRPRVAQVGALVMISAMFFAPTYSPQYVLWLLGWVALARPRLRDWAIFSATELLYFMAVWGHLQGNLRIGGGEDIGYPLAIVVRLAGLVYLAWLIVLDVLGHSDDPGRVPLVDDPQGGVLDGAPDAAWMHTPPAELAR